MAKTRNRYPNAIRNWKQYEKAVRKYESEGMTTSDAQAVVDAQLMALGICPISFQPLTPSYLAKHK